MNYPLNEIVLQVKESGIRRFFDIANKVEGVISLGVGEPDFPTPWHIRDEAIYHIKNEDTFYTANAGLMELREAIANVTEKKIGVEYAPENEILVTIGASQGIDLAMRTMLNPGDEVIYCEPSYVTYRSCIEMARGVAVPITLREEDRFVLTPELLEAAITDKTKILMLNFPNNPTGAIMTREELAKLVPIIEKHNLMILTDEIYAELTYTDEAHASIVSFEGMKERCVYLNGFSKSYAMTGWRLGYACAPKELMKQMVKVHQHTIMCAPTISQYAALEALRYGESDVIEMRESYNQRRRFILSKFKSMGIDCFEPKGAFYTFPSIKKYGMSSEEFCMKLVDEEKVAVVPGSAFGDSGEGFIRVSYAYSIEELQQALTKIAHFVGKL